MAEVAPSKCDAVSQPAAYRYLSEMPARQFRVTKTDTQPAQALDDVQRWLRDLATPPDRYNTQQLSHFT
jgi:hypothetical protein